MANLHRMIDPQYSCAASRASAEKKMHDRSRPAMLAPISRQWAPPRSCISTCHLWFCGSLVRVLVAAPRPRPCKVADEAHYYRYLGAYFSDKSKSHNGREFQAG